MSGLDFDQESTDFPAGDGAMKMQQRGPKVAGWSEIDLEGAEPPHVDDVSFISVASREAIALARLGDERPAGCRPGLAVHSRTVAVVGPLSKCGGRSAPAGASPAKRGTRSFLERLSRPISLLAAERERERERNTPVRVPR